MRRRAQSKIDVEGDQYENVAEDSEKNDDRQAASDEHGEVDRAGWFAGEVIILQQERAEIVGGCIEAGRRWIELMN